MKDSFRNFCNKPNGLHRFASIRIATLAGAFSVGLLFVFAGSSLAQEKHFLNRGNAAPGLVAQKKILEDPNLAVVSQPVQVITPDGSTVALWSSQGFSMAHDSTVNAAMSIGQVYRLKVSNIPRFFDRDIYPSIEVIDRLHAPEGMENDFPIKIVITQDDLEKAIRGQMVTRVIYLENPEMSMPHRQTEKDQPSFDIGYREDPLRVAERLGRPIAIVRMGSRVPMFNDVSVQTEFDFFSQPAKELPPPNPIFPKVDMMSGQVFEHEVQELVPNTPQRNLPPVVPGEAYRDQRTRQLRR